MKLLRMFDSIENNIPGVADAAAGYTSGSWPTYIGFLKLYPKLAAQGRIISIAVNSGAYGRAADIEQGDLSPWQAPDWFKNHADHKHGLPILYCSASVISAVVNAMSAAGIARDQYLIWSAHYGFKHICGPGTCGFPQADGTQFDDRALGQNLDESVVPDTWFPGAVVVPAIYKIYSPTLVPIGKTGRAFSELQMVQEYDDLRRHPWANRFRLGWRRQVLYDLAMNVKAHAVLHRTPAGYPGWLVRDRYLRYKGLTARAHGEQPVK